MPLQWWNWCRPPPAPLTVRIGFATGGFVPVVPESVRQGFAGVPGCLQVSRASSMLVGPVTFDRARKATSSLADVTTPLATLGGFSGVEPGSIAFSGDAGNVVDRIVWTAWNSSTAIGIGRWGYDTCTPNCARGTVTLYPATVTLSRPAPVVDVVDVVDQTHRIGTDGTVLVATDDGGTDWKTWKPAVTMRDAEGSPLTLDFLSPTLGWAVPRDSGGPLWWTTDGGRTWAAIAI